MKENTNLSRFISYVLRHNPDAAGIKLSENGWADVNELLDGINKTGRKINFETLKTIVDKDNKRRFSFNDDMTKIRANQGHSINVQVEMAERIPPDVLYHGTAERFLENIKKYGIVKKTRRYVHLSNDAETAIKVGSRHGKPVVLTIDTKQMVADGYRFLLSANGVWQSQDVPWKYIIEVKSKE